jgi:hypothetical protein
VVLGAALAFLWANGALRPAGEVVLATHDGTELAGGQVELSGLSGALIR